LKMTTVKRGKSLLQDSHRKGKRIIMIFKNSWISGGLSSSSRRRRRGEGRGGEREWRKKGSVIRVDVEVDNAKSEIKVGSRRGH